MSPFKKIKNFDATANVLSYAYFQVVKITMHICIYGRIRQWTVTYIGGWPLVNEPSHIWLTSRKWIGVKYDKADSVLELNATILYFSMLGTAV